MLNNLLVINFFLSMLLTTNVYSKDSSLKISKYVSTEYGVSIMGAHTYGPIEDISSSMIIAYAQFDYDKVWRHWAPKNLRWRLEFATGMTIDPYQKNMTSLGMIARYYFFEKPKLNLKINPYIEGGIGGIYTDYKIEEQGLRINFNPQGGLGLDFKMYRHKYFISARYHHVSNANLNIHNRGINNIAFFIGYYF